MQELFDVYFFYPDGTNTRERENVSAERAVAFAREATQRPAVALGMLSRIMITDKMDHCVFLWEAGKGIVFPPRESK